RRTTRSAGGDDRPLRPDARPATPARGPRTAAHPRQWARHHLDGGTRERGLHPAGARVPAQPGTASARARRRGLRHPEPGPPGPLPLTRECPRGRARGPGRRRGGRCDRPRRGRIGAPPEGVALTPDPLPRLGEESYTGSTGEALRDGSSLEERHGDAVTTGIRLGCLEALHQRMTLQHLVHRGAEGTRSLTVDDPDPR